MLTHMIAHVTGRTPGDFVHAIGDAHIYVNHKDALEEQVILSCQDIFHFHSEGVSLHSKKIHGLETNSLGILMVCKLI